MKKEDIPFEEKKKRARFVLREMNRLVPDARMILNYSNNWELLVAVQLSAQCTDKQVNIVTKKLFKKYRTLDDYLHADPREFERDIFPTGFYKNKTKNILTAARMVADTFGGKIPRSMHDLLTLPGVGRKTANVVLGNAYSIAEGIAVDTHVRRLSQLFGLTKESDPDKIEKDLIQLFPKKEWFSWTYKMIEYGRRYCPARCTHERCPIFSKLNNRP